MLPSETARLKFRGGISSRGDQERRYVTQKTVGQAEKTVFENITLNACTVFFFFFQCLFIFETDRT